MKTGGVIVSVVVVAGFGAAAYYFLSRKSASMVSGGGRAQQLLPARQYAQNYGVNRTAVPPTTMIQQFLPAVIETLPSVAQALAGGSARDTFVPDVPVQTTDYAGGTTSYFGD